MKKLTLTLLLFLFLVELTLVNLIDKTFAYGTVQVKNAPIRQAEITIRAKHHIAMLPSMIVISDDS